MRHEEAKDARGWSTGSLAITVSILLLSICGRAPARSHVTVRLFLIFENPSTAVSRSCCDVPLLRRPVLAFKSMRSLLTSHIVDSIPSP